MTQQKVVTSQISVGVEEVVGVEGLVTDSQRTPPGTKREMGRDGSASTAPPLASTAPPLRKGPWMAEEDQVLIEYVRKHGPRDWSSIRHKGLLPRSGKSCRLRWVNKLKPDLKS